MGVGRSFWFNLASQMTDWPGVKFGHGFPVEGAGRWQSGRQFAKGERTQTNAMALARKPSRRHSFVRPRRSRATDEEPQSSHVGRVTIANPQWSKFAQGPAVVGSELTGPSWFPPTTENPPPATLLWAIQFPVPVTSSPIKPSFIVLSWITQAPLATRIPDPDGCRPRSCP